MRRAAILPAFFLSGAAGLVYQVAWMRRLQLFMGSTGAATATVLAVFMAGLAAGSLLIGRAGDRRARPWRLYAALELGVAALGFSSGWWLDGLGGLYVQCARALPGGASNHLLLRLMFAFAALFIPAALMGGTLPVLLRGMTRNTGDAGRGTAILYAVNTLGAAFGAALCALVLIRLLGVNGAIRTAACLNLTAAMIALIFGGADATVPAAGGNAGDTPPSAPPPRGHSAQAVKAALVVAGAVGMAYEVLWTRQLMYVLQANSVYAFAAVLVAFLCGIVLGSAVCAGLSGPRRNYAAALGVTLVLCGAAALWTALTTGALASFMKDQVSFWAGNGAMFAKSAIVLLVPAALRGAIFPLAVRACAPADGRIARACGDLFALNAAGAAAGAVVGALAVLPLLGLRRGLFALASVDMAAGIAVVLCAGVAVRGRRAAGAAALLLAAAASGYVVAAIASDPARKVLVTEGEKLLLYRDDADASVAVVEQADGQRVLIAAGEIQAGSEPGLQLHLRLLGHLPALFSREPRHALVVGLGSGITAGSLLCHPVERLDVVELSGAMREAALSFSAWNGAVCSDPRVRLLRDDGRNFLLVTTNTYDVISTDPLDPDTAGATLLYSKEYYELVRQRLRPGGVACQWLPTVVDADHYRVLVRTFLAVFPNCSLWNAGQTTILVGATEGPGGATRDEFLNACARPQVRQSLAEVGIAGPEELMRHLAAGPGQVARLLGDGPMNTDDRPIVEYAEPFYGRAALVPAGE